MTDYIDEVFGPAGHFARAVGARYEQRAGQVCLARAIEKAIGSGTHLLAEAPCGTGKSLAYCVPAIWHAVKNKKRCLIVTASIALQEQLVHKDLPELAAQLPWPFEFALLKGKSNYLCLEQFEQRTLDGLPPHLVSEFEQLERWAIKTSQGNKSELPTLPSDAVWSRFSTRWDKCRGQDCAHYEECFATAARSEAAKADIVVTNYHMLILHLAHGRRILPDFDVLILDEGHAAADIAREYLGAVVSRYAFFELAREADRRKKGEIATNLREASTQYFHTLRRFAESGHYEALLRGPVPIDVDPLRVAIADFIEAVPSHSSYAQKVLDRVLAAAAQLDENAVYWIDVSEAGNAGYRSKNIAVGGFLAAELWAKTPTVIAVSATMTIERRFDFIRQELGTPPAAELVVDSPFDYPRNALMVMPEGMPDPNDPSFIGIAAERIVEMIALCGGRTMVLFTSYRALHAVRDRVHHRLPSGVRLLMQGELPRNELIRLFKTDVRSVLFGTRSMWTGIDVPGEALTGLVIDRVPFDPKDDPVSARIRQKSPKQWFNRYALPRAIVLLTQGAGRLLRREDDIGVFMLLDPKPVLKPYGKRILRSLPPMRQANSITAIRPFLREHGREYEAAA